MASVYFDRLGIPLTPLKTRIFDAIRRAGPDGIAGDAIIHDLGLPVSPTTLKAHVWQINARLAENGYKIVGYGGYRLLKRHTMMVALGVLPLLVFGVIGLSRPAPAAPPMITKPVMSEGVTMRRMDEGTFRARWSGVADMPATTVTEVHYLVVQADEAVGGAGAVSAVTLPSRRLRTRPVRLDICQRHNMRRVNYGRTWRCRR
jgi:hypothetical protein